MRTTLVLDDDLVRAAKAMASQRRASLGQVVSDLALKGLRAARPAPTVKVRFPVFPVGPDAPPITLEDIKRADDEL